MKVNFDIIDNYALNFQGLHIDLHNNFDFVGLDYKVEQRELKLTWNKTNGEWVDKNELSQIILTHCGVDYLKIIEQDDKSILQDDNTLGEISFFPSTSREINDSIIPQQKPNELDDIIYSFENGQVIRIHCNRVELNVKLPTHISDTTFANNSLTEEEAFWVMRYFLHEHYDLSGGQFDVSDILSATQPFEFDDKGHFDGKVVGDRIIKPADHGMVWHWNEALKKYRELGRPKPEALRNDQNGC